MPAKEATRKSFQSYKAFHDWIAETEKARAQAHAGWGSVKVTYRWRDSGILTHRYTVQEYMDDERLPMVMKTWDVMVTLRATR